MISYSPPNQKKKTQEVENNIMVPHIHPLHIFTQQVQLPRLPQLQVSPRLVNL